jgi:hypothetical protein
VMAIPYRSARATVSASSSRMVRPASIASTYAPAARIDSIVCRPTAGTSNRMS